VATLIIYSTLVLLIGYLVIDDIEYAEESILSHLGLQLFNRGAHVKKADDRGDGG
jgi:hypothetical protein